MMLVSSRAWTDLGQISASNFHFSNPMSQIATDRGTYKILVLIENESLFEKL